MKRKRIEPEQQSNQKEDNQKRIKKFRKIMKNTFQVGDDDLIIKMITKIKSQPKQHNIAFDILRKISTFNIFKSIRLDLLTKPKTHKSIVSTFFSITPTFNIGGPRKRRTLIKSVIKKKDIGNLVKPYLLEGEKPPGLYERQIDFIITKARGRQTNNYKRFCERSNLKNIKQDDRQTFTSICNVNIPFDIMMVIFGYIGKNMKNLNNISLINSHFYIMFLKSWNALFITKKNLLSIPTVVLNSSRKILLCGNFFVDDYVYMSKNIQSVIKFNIKNFRKFSRNSSASYRNCTSLTVDTLDVNVVNLKFPNLRRIKITEKCEIVTPSMLSLLKLTRRISFPYVIRTDCPTWIADLKGSKVQHIDVYVKTYCIYNQSGQIGSIVKDMMKYIAQIDITRLNIIACCYSFDNHIIEYIVEYLEKHLPMLNHLSITRDTLYSGGIGYHDEYRYKFFDNSSNIKKLNNIKNLKTIKINDKGCSKHFVRRHPKNKLLQNIKKWKNRSSADICHCMTHNLPNFLFKKKSLTSKTKKDYLTNKKRTQISGKVMVVFERCT